MNKKSQARSLSCCGNRDVEQNFAYTLGSVESYYEGYIWEKTVDSEEAGRNNEPAVTAENIYSGIAILWNVL
ncbi:MAG: hypothetical protein GXY08_01170 [Ruminococcus sp.]|nr:hypothetical protein [Ruminococcus sp.]